MDYFDSGSDDYHDGSSDNNDNGCSDDYDDGWTVNVDHDDRPAWKPRDDLGPRRSDSHVGFGLWWRTAGDRYRRLVDTFLGGSSLGRWANDVPRGQVPKTERLSWMNPTETVVEDASPVDGSESDSGSQPWLKSFFARGPAGDVPALGSRAQLVRISLVVFAVLLVAFLASISVVGGMQQRSAQQKAFNSFRVELAEGTAPTGPVNVERQMIRPGTAVAYLEVPSIGIQQVVFAGTSSSITMDGPGYRMDTVFPGQVGTSIVMGRRASFGAPFGRLS